MILLAAAVLTLAGCGDQIGDKYVNFAKCLTQSGVKMYGAFWCPHCQTQKEMFGPLGFKEINYIECGEGVENSKHELCQKKGIAGLPTWEFADGSRAEGEVTLAQLAQRSGCRLPEENNTGATVN